MSQPEFGPADAQRDKAPLIRMLSLAFASPMEGVEQWIATADFNNFRVLRERGMPAACALRVPMGQFFGGRAIPMVGIAGVAVAPEFRGRGLATRVMQETLREVRAEGVPISTLYPATLPLYRRVGYEQAGYWMEYRLPIARIDVQHSSLPVRPMEPEDLGDIKRCYSEVSRGIDGYLDRGEYVWGRILNPRQGPATGFVIDCADSVGVCGYVFIRQERLATMRHDVHVTDICAATPTAGARLLNFLSEFASVGNDAVFYGGPLHPLTPLLGEQKYTMSFKEYWMLRVVDVRRALTTRAYLPNVRADLHLDIGDDLFPENAGRYLVHIREGHAAVERGGTGSLRLNIRAFASLYSGFASPHSLKLLGHIEGDDISLAAAGAAFAGPPPSMPDMF
jgi:predicted acetyltransferase